MRGLAAAAPGPRPPQALASEADLLRVLEAGTYTLEELYCLCEAGVAVERDGGRRPIEGHGGDQVWKRRVRSVLQALRRSGRAERVGRATWAIAGSRERPERMLLVLAAEPRAFELRLAEAIELLSELEEPADLVVADPPYGLGRGRGEDRQERLYRRDWSRVVGGYRDVDPAEYEEFTDGWIAAAASALRPAGQLCVVSGPQRAALVQSAAERAGLTWVSSIAARRAFALRTTRRPSISHWTVTVMTRGRLEDRRRVFRPPADLPRARSGVEYPLDLWLENGRADRPGALRYDNSLPLRLVERIVSSFSDLAEHVVDPFLGGGTAAVACQLLGRRFTGADVNPEALRFTAARLLAEHLWPEERQPRLFAEAAPSAACGAA